MEAWNDQIQGLFLKETTTLVYSLNSSHHAVTLPVNQLWCIAIFTEQHIVYTHTVVHSHDALRTLPAVNTFCTHVAHSFFVVLSMNGQCVFSSPALWRWKATWPFYQPLVETFDNTVTTWARAHTHGQTFPFQTFFSVSCSPSLHLLALSSNTYKDKHTNST